MRESTLLITISRKLTCALERVLAELKLMQKFLAYALEAKRKILYNMSVENKVLKQETTMKLFDDKFECKPYSPSMKPHVELKAFGGGQGWGVSFEAAEKMVDAAYDILMRDNDMQIAPPREVETDIKAGIAKTLFEGELTERWGG
jgi:hypothetical protein